MGDRARGEGATEEEPSPVARGLARMGVSPEVLYERYRGERGMELKFFLKMFRDSVLYDNSWTWGMAVTVFFDHAVDDDSGLGGGVHERRLSFHTFRSCLRRFIRQSTLVTKGAREMQQQDASSSTEDAEYFRWEAFKMIVGQRLHGTPRSDEDAILNNWFLLEPIQLLCLQNEYHLRRVYRQLIKSKSEPTAKPWDDLCKPDPPVLLKKDFVVKSLREIIPKEHGGLRSDDQSNALRYGNHENTSHEEGTKDKSSGAASFPEWLEMTVRCALGTTPFASAPGGDGSGNDQAEEDEDATDARPFSPDTDSAAFAQQRIRKIWEWLFASLHSELELHNHKSNDENIIMEDCPTYDQAYSDVQMLFAHYASGEPYSRTLDFTDPDLRLSVMDLLRQCRDCSILDYRVTLVVIGAEYYKVMGTDLASNRSLRYASEPCLYYAVATRRAH